VKYQTVSLPQQLVAEVEKELEKNKLYKNVPDFVADATRRRLIESRMILQEVNKNE